MLEWIVAVITFVPPPRPADECARLSALQALGVLDTAPEVTFDRMIGMIAAIWDVPIAALSPLRVFRQKTRYSNYRQFALHPPSFLAVFCIVSERIVTVH